MTDDLRTTDQEWASNWLAKVEACLDDGLPPCYNGSWKSALFDMFAGDLPYDINQLLSVSEHILSLPKYQDIRRRLLQVSKDEVDLTREFAGIDELFQPRPIPKPKFELASGVAPDLDHEQVRQYLNDLQESGRINMFGAAPWLEKEFGVSRLESKKLLIGWMEAYE